jgi:hypothetical protein
MFDQDQVYTEVQQLVDTKADATFQRHYAYYSTR